MLQPSKFKVSIIIPCLNEEKYIGNLLANLENQEGIDSEIIVVDGGSKDKTINIVHKFPKIRLIKSKPQVADQRHLGAKKAKGNLLIFLDADSKIPKNFLTHGLREFEERGLDIGCPFYSPYPFSYLTLLIYFFFNIMFFIFQKISPSGAGSCIIVTNSLYHKSGGFDSKYKFDDIQFIRKASKLGIFGMLSNYIYVSDRRFRQYGNFKMFLTYLLLSVLFLVGAFKLANKIPYGFNYKK
jgi:glycosyltransferase involved in cell wall biosynthesis